MGSNLPGFQNLEGFKTITRRPDLKISRMLTLIAFLAILAMATHMSINSDTWWHLRSGQWMVENRALITEDTFSFTRAGTPWQYPGLCDSGSDVFGV